MEILRSHIQPLTIRRNHRRDLPIIMLYPTLSRHPQGFSEDTAYDRGADEEPGRHGAEVERVGAEGCDLLHCVESYRETDL